MNVKLRAAGRMALICVITLLMNASKIVHAGWIPVILVFTALIIYTYCNPKKFFPNIE